MMVWRVANTDCALPAQTEEVKLCFSQGRDFGFSAEISCDEVALFTCELDLCAGASEGSSATPVRTDLCAQRFQ